MRLHDRAILYFDAVREYGSIREAARRLNITPSALTRQLGQMEAEIGAPLFDRLPGGMVMTAVGEIVARHIVTVVQDARRTDERIAALRGGQEGRVSVMAVAGVMGGLLPRILKRMMTRHPGIVIHAEPGSPGMIARSLSSGQTDLGIAFSLEPLTDLRQITVATFPVGAIVPEGHPLARKATVSVSECLKFPLILPSSTLSLRWVMEPFLRSQREQLRIVVETGSIELTNRMVAEGAGIAFQSWLALEPGNTGLVHVPLRDVGATTDLGVYVREARWLPPSLEALIAEVRIALGETDGGAD
ncbi:LysR family transcriptional regulator [Acetobacter musti]|uniref:LysR family transcriptional regulator n=1 Tax=Acetobacter musti TaxID=864732 RepID=A0ABX0JRB1_9PROT|nr:LysR family transcriptional regulator [Acetobacter musti]NHN85545.1 LysR family transcriptional regulator [Acetobacter musti]